MKKKATSPSRPKPDVQKTFGELTAVYQRAFEGIQLVKNGKLKEARMAQRDAQRMMEKIEHKLPKKS